MIVITNNIREIRKQSGLTQAELAQRLFVRQSTISQIETGERTPSLPLLIRIAAELGVTVNDLIAEVVDAVPND